MAINDTAIDDVIITGDFNDNQLEMTHPYDYGLTMILKKIVFQNQHILL
jgi:hypothetical protein